MHEQKFGAPKCGGRSARYVGSQAVQLHGGMGMTDELVMGHYYKRLSMCDPVRDADWYCASSRTGWIELRTKRLIMLEHYVEGIQAWRRETIKERLAPRGT